MTTHFVLHLDPQSHWYQDQKAQQDRQSWQLIRILHPRSRQLGAWLGTEIPRLSLPVIGLPKRHLFKTLEIWMRVHRPLTHPDP